MVHEYLLQYPLMFLGSLIFIGTVSSLYLERLRIPHIVVYLITGFVLANTVFVGVDLQTEIHEWFIFIENIVLGLIGFKIGTELKAREVLAEKRTVLILLIAETSSAFIFAFVVVLAISGNLLLSVIMGGLATATAPATTVEIFRKLRARGRLTTLAQWILALDDIVAVFVIETVLVFVTITIGAHHSALDFVVGLSHEIGLAIILGLLIGLMLEFFIEQMREELPMMELTLAVLFATMGLAQFLETSVIVTTMTIGATTTNLGGDNYVKAQNLLEIIMSPMIILFFTLVGSRVLVEDFLSVPLIAFGYLLARTAGKLLGFTVGGKFTELRPEVRDNLGFSFLAQGGVTLGLATVISEKLLSSNYEWMGLEIEKALVIATLFSITLGSFGARYAVNRAGESAGIPQESSRT